jgi:predicted dehydrogenase
MAGTLVAQRLNDQVDREGGAMFRALIIGAGFGSRVVAGCYEEAGMTVQVVSPRDPQTVRAACAEPFDLVSVHSPPFLHAEHVNLALDHGHAVLCDKPFGVSAEEARQMLTRAREIGVVHLLNFEFRYDPGRRRVKEIIDSGGIGRVVHMNWNFYNSFSRIPLRKHGWQFDKWYGGWLRINGTHMVDAIRWLVGEIVEVDCRVRTDVGERPDQDGKMQTSTAEDAFTANLTTDTGASVVIDTAWAVSGTLPDRWSVVGTDGIIDVTEAVEIYAPPMVRDTHITWHKDGNVEVERIGPFEGDGHLPAMRPWAVAVREAVSNGRQIQPSFDDGLACSEVIDRLHAAALGRGAR